MTIVDRVNNRRRTGEPSRRREVQRAVGVDAHRTVRARRRHDGQRITVWIRVVAQYVNTRQRNIQPSRQRTIIHCVRRIVARRIDIDGHRRGISTALPVTD